MSDGKIFVEPKLPEDLTDTEKTPKFNSFKKAMKAKRLSEEDIAEQIEEKTNHMFKSPRWEDNPKISSMKDILDKDGRRHIEIRDVLTGTIKKVDDI